jgi:hypothetical protein
MKKLTCFLTFSLFLVTFLSYSQYTGATPWENCFGINASCKTYPKDGYLVGCSEIQVSSSKSSPVVAIVKRYGKVLKHAYISAGQTYSFDVSDGTYQLFFYWGKNWNSRKKINSDECSIVYGGFTENESVSKDTPITLNSQIINYTLTQVSFGNFEPKSSSLNEAL